MTGKDIEAASRPVRNCENCANLGSDGDGYEYNGTWPICDAEKPRANLKSFPFKKVQPCHEPNFWKYVEEDEELSKMFDAEILAREKGDETYDSPLTFARFNEKYCQTEGRPQGVPNPSPLRSPGELPTPEISP